MDCDRALELFSQQAFDEWHGLPAECRFADISRKFQLVADARGQSRLGDRQASFAVVTVSGYTEPVRVWLDDADRVVLMDVEYPSMRLAPGDLLRVLGEPAAKLDTYWGTIELDAAEWVYPDRGLVLFINPDTNEVLRLGVFPATSLDGYEREFRMNLRQRRLPQPRARS